MTSASLRRKSAVRKKSDRQYKLDKLHGLWRIILIARDGERCAAAGEGSIRCGLSLQAHHIYGKIDYPALRFDLDNGIIACRGHHFWWIHSAPAPEVAAWLAKSVGQERLERLALKAAASRANRSRMDLEAVRLFLQQEFSKYFR
jgi:hypothetical protein